MSDGRRRDEMANDLGAKGWKSQGRPAVASAAVVHARTGTTGWMMDGQLARSLAALLLLIGYMRPPATEQGICRCPCTCSC
jgi:hypothetical protein